MKIDESCIDGKIVNTIEELDIPGVDYRGRKRRSGIYAWIYSGSYRSWERVAGGI